MVIVIFDGLVTQNKLFFVRSVDMTTIPSVGVLVEVVTKLKCDAA